jgi:hypothetical protein
MLEINGVVYSRVIDYSIMISRVLIHEFILIQECIACVRYIKLSVLTTIIVLWLYYSRWIRKEIKLTSL